MTSFLWHLWVNEHEFEQTQGYNEEQGSLLFCSPWGHKELDNTERLNNNNNKNNQVYRFLKMTDIQVS